MSLHDPKRNEINLAIVDIGNCASSLVQGIVYCQNGGANEQIGLMHWDLGGYRPGTSASSPHGTWTSARSGATSPMRFSRGRTAPKSSATM